MSHTLPTTMPENGSWKAGVESFSADILDKMERAVWKIRDRLLRATKILNSIKVPYAVVGGNAVATYVARVDEGAVRNTRDIDILVRREDLPVIREAFEKEGFVYTFTWGVDTILDGPNAKPSESIHLLFTGERVKPNDLLPTPEIVTERDPAEYEVLLLEPLVQMKLLSYRHKDKAHLVDMIQQGIIDASWPAKYPPELAARLQLLLDTPDG